MPWSSRSSSFVNLFKRSSKSLLFSHRRSKTSDVKDHIESDKIADEASFDEKSEDHIEPADHPGTAELQPHQQPAEAVAIPDTDDFPVCNAAQQVVIESAGSSPVVQDPPKVLQPEHCHIRHESNTDLVQKEKKVLRPHRSRYIDSVDAQESMSGPITKRSELRAQLDLGPIRHQPNRVRDNDRMYRESMAYLELKRTRLAELRQRLHQPEEIKHYPKVADLLSVWQRQKAILQNRLQREMQSRMNANEPKVIEQNPEALYQRTQAWRCEAELRCACATVDRDLQQMIDCGFLARTSASLSFHDWKTHTEFRFRKYFYDEIQNDITQLWMLLR